jgi:hypothetical protein
MSVATQNEEVSWFKGDAPTTMGALAYGLYRGAVESGPPTPAMALAPLRRKRWIYLGVYDPRFVFGVAAVNIGFASNAFAYLGDIGGRGPRAWSAVGAPWSARADRSNARWSAGGNTFSIELPEGGRAGHARGSLDVGGGEKARFDLALAAPDARSAMTCVAPAGDDARGRWIVTVKDSTLTATGTVRWGAEERAVSAPAIFDVTDAYAPRHTVWRWASFAGRDRAGRRAAVNLCALHNDSERARENVLWLDGAPRALGAVHFHFDASAPGSAPWRIAGDGVDLRFEPSGMRVGHEDLVVVKSRFVQPYGLFYGEVRGVRFEGVPGVVEDHDALW